MKAAPNSKDIQDFQFKQNRLIQVHDDFKNIPIACNLIVADSKRGLLYSAYENQLTVLKIGSDSENDWKHGHNLPHTISRLSVSCDFSYLGVTFNTSAVHIYNASSVSKHQLELINTIIISPINQNVFAYDLRWNPTIPGMFCTVASDHSIGTFQIKADQRATVNVIALENIQELQATCVAWSPKGKQIVIGCKNGNIVQLKPEIKIARTIFGPSPPIGEVITILWISNYQFCAAYLNANERRINVLIIDAPKGETKTIFTCYEDITYGMPEVDGEYSPRYYFDYVPEWNLIIAASSSSSEIAILGSVDNGVNWEQWQLTDSGRAQLPLVRTVESYPVGMTIDKSSTIILPWGPESTLPYPVPILYIFGTSGQIVSFHMVNLFPNCLSICSPPSEPFIPPQRVNMPPSEIMFTLNTAATSTPRPKQIETSIERPKAVVPTPSFFSEPTKPIPTSTPVSIPQQVSQVQPQVELKIPKTRTEQSVVVPPPKPEARTSPVKELQITSPAPPPAPVIDKIAYDSIFWRNFCEEIGHFEKELQSKLEIQVWEIGTDEEKQKLITQCAQMDEFGQDLIETTSSLTNDVIYLKALFLQTFAWMEEIKSRNSTNGGDISRNYHDRSKIEELQRRFSHTQSQLLQAMKALDIRWTENESQERTKMKIPSLEFIYQNLKKHAEIIAKEKETIEHLSRKWKTLARGNKISGLNQSIAKLSISSNNLKSPGVNINGGIIEMRCKTIANNTKNFTREKQIRLKDVLSKTTPRIIKAINPSPVQDKLEATLTFLASQNATAVMPKQKEKIVSDRIVSEAPKVSVIPVKSTNFASNIISVNVGSIATTGTTVVTAPVITSVIKTTSAPQNPLASLNSIVAKLGTGNESTAAIQPKTQPLNFSSTFPLVFGNHTSIKSPEKSTLLGNQQIVKTISTQPNLPMGQLPSITTAFPKPILFGSSEQKQENVPTVAKDNIQKTSLTFKPKETSALSESLFQPNPIETPLFNGATSIKSDQPSTPQQNLSASLGTNFNLSLNEPHQTVANSQQNVFSFAKNSSFNQMLSKTSTPTAATTSAANIQPFFFPVKSGDTVASTPVTSESSLQNVLTTTTATTATNSGLDFSKMSLAMSSLTDKPQVSTNAPVSVISTVTSSIPATTINFGTAVSATSAANTSHEIKNLLNLPSGTTIEKLSITSNNTAPVSSPSKMFSITGSNIFGNNAAIVSTSTPKFDNTNPITSTASAKPAVTSAPSFFGSSLSGFLQTSQSTVPSNIGSQTINFGKPPTTPITSSNVFEKPAVSATSMAPASIIPSALSSSLFGQPAVSSSNAASPIKPAVGVTGFFTNTQSPSNTSPFSTVQTSPTQNIFGGGNVNPEGTSIFGGTPAPSTLFGQSTPGSIFGGSPKPAGTMFDGAPTFGTMGTTTGFGSPPAFGSKPMFGTQPVFGAPKPEFGATFGSSFGTMGFGTPSPPIGTTPMDKVFGSSSGSSTFESLAGQTNNLTFGSLAQKSPSPEKPAFSGGNSFTAWR